MALIILKPTRRFSWPFVLSAGLHTSLVAGLLYTSVNQITAPTAVEQPMRVTLVAPEPEPVAAPPQPPVEPPEVEPTAAPEPAPEPVREPDPIPAPEPPAPVQQPKPLPKPKPVHKEAAKPRPKVTEPRAEPTPLAAPPREAPVRAAPAPAPAPSAPVADTGPKAISRPEPGYPERARALGIEGTVKIQFDVDDSGQVENLRIISATPRNMFEREIRQVIRRWRYQSGKPGKNQTTTIEFKLSGVSSS
ncbi:energy transducer TonB [Sodalis sp. RH22]|uniref:energy transducer TonB n=1 Tax=unclassified Sodalis (in: enterobacteria) TaxID=2636512 RepID=UPI0039B52C7F